MELVAWARDMYPCPAAIVAATRGDAEPAVGRQIVKLNGPAPRLRMPSATSASFLFAVHTPLRWVMISPGAMTPALRCMMLSAWIVVATGSVTSPNFLQPNDMPIISSTLAL